MKISKIKIGNSSTHLSRKVMLLGYAVLIGIGIIILIGFGLNLTISSSEKTITPQKQISIDQERVDELENFKYLGKELYPDTGVGRDDPFNP